MSDTISCIALLISSIALLVSVKNWARINRIDRHQLRITYVIAEILDTVRVLTSGSLDLIKILKGKDESETTDGHTVRSRRTNKKTRWASYTRWFKGRLNDVYWKKF